MGSLTRRLSKLSISNSISNMSTSSKAVASHHDEVKLKNDVRIEFFSGERAKLRAYLM